MATYPEVIKFMQKYGDSISSEQKTRLRGFGKGGSGRKDSLEESIKNIFFNSGKELNINFYMADYGKFVDQGVQGWESGKTGIGGASSIYKYKPKDGKHKPQKKSKFIESLMKWNERKGIPKGLAFVIRKNIWSRGIEKTNFFTIPITRNKKRFDNGIEKALALDIENDIKKIKL